MKCYSYTSRASMEIQKARRATPASKPTCNRKGTTCTPPWKSTYPCPIPSILAKCFHPRLDSRPRPQVLYTEVCTQDFAILLPPPAPFFSSRPLSPLSVPACRTFLGTAAVHFTVTGCALEHAEPLLQFLLFCEVAFHAIAVLVHRAGPLPSAPCH